MPTVPRGASSGLSTSRLKSSSFFFLKRLGASVFLLFVAGALLAAVAGNEAPAAAKVVNGKLAVVGAATAADMLLRHGKVRDVLGRKNGRGAVGAGAMHEQQEPHRRRPMRPAMSGRTA